MPDYLLQEDGSSHFDLEDLSGDIILEPAVSPPSPPGSCFISVGGQVFRG